MTSEIERTGFGGEYEPRGLGGGHGCDSFAASVVILELGNSSLWEGPEELAGCGLSLGGGVLGDGEGGRGGGAGSWWCGGGAG